MMKLPAHLLLVLSATSIASVSMVDGAAPVVAEHSWGLADIIVHGMQFRLTVLEVEFDQDIFLNGMAINSANLSRGGTGGDGMPALSVMAQGMSRATCGAHSWSSIPGPANGPPSEIMTAMKTADSTATFLGSIGGARFPEPISPRGIAFAKIIGMKSGSWQYFDATASDVRACNLTLYLNSSLANAAGEMLAPDTTVVFDGPERVTQCTYEGMKEFDNAVNFLLQAAEQLTGVAGIDKLEFMFASLESRGVLAACKRKTTPFFHMHRVLRPLPATRECNDMEGSMEFAMNPCCNHTLEFSRCCEKKSASALRSVLKNVSVPAVEAACANPGRVKNTIADFIKEQQAVSVEPPNRRALEEEYEGFRSDCDTLIYNSKCSSNAECFSSQECDTDQKRCIVPYGNETGLLTECFARKMKPEMKKSLGIAWDIDETNDEAFLAELRRQVVVDDCVGPGSWEYRKNWRQNDEGEWVIMPGNRTLCLAEKECNWDNRLNREECLSTTPVEGLHFCGECWGGGDHCGKRSRPSYCQLNHITGKTACEADGKYWYRYEWEDTTSDTSGRCVDTSRNTSALCAPPSICPSLYDSDGNYQSWRCNMWAMHGCYTTQLNKTQCDSIEGSFQHEGQWSRRYWDSQAASGNGLCRVQNWNWQSNLWTQDDCSSFDNVGTFNGEEKVYNWTVFLGADWQEGELNTEQQCTYGKCNWENPFNDYVDVSRLTKEECESKSMCTERCPRCAQTRHKGNNVCFSNSTSYTEDQCKTAGGDWQSNVWDGSDSRCILMINTNATACAASGVPEPIFADCAILTTREQCNQGHPFLNEFLQCDWRDWAPCRNAAECEGSGQCDDWELFQWGFTEAENVRGGCVVKGPLRDDGWPDSCSSQKSVVSGFTDQGNQWSRYPGKCIDQGAKSEATCNSISGTWMNKSYTEAQCLSPPKKCYYRRGGDWNGLNEAECNKCEGTMQNAYNWNGGTWMQAEMKGYRWMQKEWRSKRQWGKTIDYIEIYDRVIRTAVAIQMQDKYFDVVRRKYAGIAPVLGKIACDCTPGGASRDCFSITPRPLAKKKFKPGEDVVIETESVGVSFTAQDSPGRRLLSGVNQLSLEAVSANELATENGSYAVVYNDYGVLVGQLVGDCAKITGFESATNTTVTLNFRYDVSIDNATYSIPHIGRLLNSTVKVFLQVEDATLINGNSIRTNDLTASGTYCPVYLSNIWTVTPAPTPAPPTTTTAPTPAPTTPIPTLAGGSTVAPTPAATTAGPTAAATTATPASETAVNPSAAWNSRPSGILFALLAIAIAAIL